MATFPVSERRHRRMSRDRRSWTAWKGPRQGLQLKDAAEDVAHDLVAAPSDRPEAGVAGGALDPVLAHVAGAAVYLQALVHQLERRALGEQLRHRHLAQRVLSGDETAQRVVGDAAAGVRGGGEVDELVTDRLVAGQRTAERAALA